MNQHSETEREALALVGLKEEVRAAEHEVTRLKNLLIDAEKLREEAAKTLTEARDKFIRKMQ